MKPNVVLVDDDEITLLIQCKLIERTGLAQQVRTYTCAQSFCAHLVEAVGFQRPTLLLLDINLPKFTA
jgi:FixJ family two-component response regulator